MEKREGVMIYDIEDDLYDIRFDIDEYYGGLHCGQCFDVLLKKTWMPTRIEKSRDWYLIDIDPKIKMQGLIVRIKD